MVKYANISVPIEVKKLLQGFKGEKTWGKFLAEELREYQKLKRKEGQGTI
jgi:hypothetical protein